MRQRQTEAPGPEQQGARGFASGGVVGRCASISRLGAGHVWRTVPYYTVLYSHTCWFETLSLPSKNRGTGVHKSAAPF